MSTISSTDPGPSLSNHATCRESTSRVSADSEVSPDDESHAKRQCHDLDTFVHEVCKAFGHLGTPEYCHGASTFRLFLASKIQHSNREQYYVDANEVHLERQVGSRY